MDRMDGMDSMDVGILVIWREALACMVVLSGCGARAAVIFQVLLPHRTHGGKGHSLGLFWCNIGCL